MYFLSFVLWGFWKAYKSRIFLFPFRFFRERGREEAQAYLRNAQGGGLTPTTPEAQSVGANWVTGVAPVAAAPINNNPHGFYQAWHETKETGKNTFRNTQFTEKHWGFRCFFVFFGSGKEASNVGLFEEPSWGEGYGMRPSEICVSCTLEQEHFHQGKTLKLCTCRSSVRPEINHDGLLCLGVRTSSPSGLILLTFAQCWVTASLLPSSRQALMTHLLEKMSAARSLALFPDCTGCQATIKSWSRIANAWPWECFILVQCCSFWAAKTR